MINHDPIEQSQKKSEVKKRRSVLSLFNDLVSKQMTEDEANDIYRDILDGIAEFGKDYIDKLKQLEEYVLEVQGDMSPEIKRKNNPQFEMITAVPAKINAQINKLRKN